MEVFSGRRTLYNYKYRVYPTLIAQLPIEPFVLKKWQCRTLLIGDAVHQQRARQRKVQNEFAPSLRLNFDRGAALQRLARFNRGVNVVIQSAETLRRYGVSGE